MASVTYNDGFYDALAEGASRSARIVVPLVLQLVSVQSVIDFGCGRGVWLSIFKDYGVKVVKGLDGAYVNESGLLISPDEFEAVDLAAPMEIAKSYDLASCLEVVEHLPESSSLTFVEMLTKSAPVVLFSAALPGQGGTEHINEQWPWYWSDLFGQFGYRKLDPLRRKLINNHEVDWWYRQNIVMYASEEAISQSEALMAEASLMVEPPFELIHTDLIKRLIRHYEGQLEQSKSLRYLISSFPSSVLQFLRSRLPFFG
jgi:hypothetical protein